MKNIQGKKLNFWELLSQLDEADTGPDLSDEDYLAIIGKVQEKVDNIQSYKSHLEAESKRLAEIVATFTKRKKAVDNATTRLMDWTLRSMKGNKMPFLLGEKYQAKIRESKAVETREGEITSAEFSTLNRSHPGIITRSYSWSKSELKKVIQSDNKAAEKLKPYAQIKINEKVNFTIKKGEK